jgi:ankyrin repeat protein
MRCARNAGFRTLNQAQLLHDTLYYPDVSEPQQWLIYMISKPLIGSLEYVPTIPPYLRDKTKPDRTPSTAGSSHGASKRKEVHSFNELLMMFPMIARQMQPGLQKVFQGFEESFEKYKPLPLPPPSPSSFKSGTSGISSRSARSTVNGDIYQQAADESEIRRFFESAITAAVDLFQRVDQSQLDLLASTTDLTGPAIDRLIERYVAEQLHDTTLFPRLCATQALQDEELEQKIVEMENVDLTQVGIPSIEQQEKKSLTNRLARGIKSFEKIGSAKSPQAMVEHLLDTARTLSKEDNSDAVVKDIGAVEKSNVTVVTMNADMLVSLLLIVVIRAKVPNLHACLTYMRNFIFNEDVEQGEMGYILSTLEAVLFHIAQDQNLSAASRANEKLWRSVRNGNIKGVTKILGKELKDADNNDGPTSSEETSEEDAESLAFGVDELSLNGVGEEDFSSLDDQSVINRTSPESEETPQANGLVNGIHKRSGSGSISRRHSVSSNGSVHISDAAPVKIPREDPLEEEDDPEADPSQEDRQASIIDGNSLVKEGPPPSEHVFDEPTSPSTGVSNVRIEELRADGNDDDSISTVQAQTLAIAQIIQKPLPTPRIAVTRFDFQGHRGPPSLQLRAPRSRSTGSVSSVTTISDISISSMILSRTGTSQSQHRDTFSAEKLSKTRNPQGESLLMMAIQHKQPEMLQYLLNMPFFDVDFLLEDINTEGSTLLSVAVQAQNMACLEILLNELLALSDEVLRRYLRIVDSFGRTVAHYLFNTPDLINRLGRWLSWTHKDKNGQTPLFALCRSYDHHRYREMMRMAIDQAQLSQGDNARLQLDEHVDTKGNTLLHIAADPGVVRILLMRCDCDVNAVNDKGYTPLMVASKYGRIEIVRTLFGDARVDLLAKELRGLTAVELAKDDDVRNRIDGKTSSTTCGTSPSLLTFRPRSRAVPESTC